MKPTALAWPLFLSLLGACALTSRGTPLEVRYFSPEGNTTRVTAQELTTIAPDAPRPLLRLGRLTSSANLRAPIVRRTSAVEVAPYETLRWTEDPEDYVRRSLSRALFDAGPFEQVVSGPALTVDVEVIAFEEAQRGAAKTGRVQLGYALHDEHKVLASGVVTVQRDALGEGIEAVVAAIGAAMDEATAELATKVSTSLRQR